MKKKIIVLVLFIVFPYTVYADCESDFKNVEKDFKVSYKYNRDTDDFDITFVNPNHEMYTFAYHDQNEIKKFEIKQSGYEETLILKGLKETEYEYAFVAKYAGCAYKTVTTGKLELKKYNPYSDSELCKGNEEFVLCQRDYDKAIDEESFKSRLETYMKGKNEKETANDVINRQENQDNKQSKSNLIKDILDYLKDHIAVAIIILVFIIALVITIILLVKKSLKSRRFE